MANPNLTRRHQKIFSENATNNGQFGSLQTGAKVETPDISVLQALAAYQEGWSDAVISGEELPSLEEFNGLHKIETEQLQYLLNKGIPEYSADAEYYIGDIQREVGGTKLYKSLTDNNIGNALTDVANWQLLIDLAISNVAAASQAEVDAGVVSDKFVAPDTLEASIYNNKELVSTATISNDATVDFTDVFESGFNYEIELTNILPVSDSVLRCRLRTTTVFQTTNYVGSGVQGSPVDAPGGKTSGTTAIDVSGNGLFSVDSSSTKGLDGTIKIKNPSSTVKHKSIDIAVNHDNPSGNFTYHFGCGSYEGSALAVNGIQFLASTGNLSTGTINIYKTKIN